MFQWGGAHGLVAPHITKRDRMRLSSSGYAGAVSGVVFPLRSFGHSVENNAIKDEAAPQYE